MSTVAEILDAAARLSADQFLELRQRLDELDEERWQEELAKTSAELEQQELTEEEIDRRVLRRRRESRA